MFFFFFLYSSSSYIIILLLIIIIIIINIIKTININNINIIRCGERTIDICYWESFGKGWKEDITNHLNIKDVREFTAPYGYLPNLYETNPNHDIIFTYNGDINLSD
jgi:phosphoserine aminotransferase